MCGVNVCVHLISEGMHNGLDSLSTLFLSHATSTRGQLGIRVGKGGSNSGLMQLSRDYIEYQQLCVRV